MIKNSPIVLACIRVVARFSAEIPNAFGLKFLDMLEFCLKIKPYGSKAPPLSLKLFLPAIYQHMALHKEEVSKGPKGCHIANQLLNYTLLSACTAVDIYLVSDSCLLAILCLERSFRSLCRQRNVLRLSTGNTEDINTSLNLKIFKSCLKNLGIFMKHLLEQNRYSNREIPLRIDVKLPIGRVMAIGLTINREFLHPSRKCSIQNKKMMRQFVLHIILESYNEAKRQLMNWDEVIDNFNAISLGLDQISEVSLVLSDLGLLPRFRMWHSIF